MYLRSMLGHATRLVKRSDSIACRSAGIVLIRGYIVMGLPGFDGRYELEWTARDGTYGVHAAMSDCRTRWAKKQKC